MKSDRIPSGDRTFLQDLFHSDRYKRSQGKIARQVTLWTLLAIVAIAAYRVYAIWTTGAIWSRLFPVPALRYAVPAVLFAVGAWISYRVVNYSRFADFLIAVENEMNKVSWPSRKELVRSSLVVIIVIALLVVVLFAFDFILRLVLGQWLRIIPL